MVLYSGKDKQVATQAKIDRIREEKDMTPQELSYQEILEQFIAQSCCSNVEKMQNFPNYVPRQYLTRFLSRYELFKKVLHVHGSIIECGVFFGGGLMSFAQFSTIFEPVNHQRKIIGFDTFEGFPELHDVDRKGTSQHVAVGALASNAYEELLQAVRVYDMNRSIGHIPKVYLVKGDARKTIPAYLESNPHTVVSLLYLDFDIYDPTKVALEHFVPRIPKSGIIAFDELNAENWPGETIALLETLGISSLRIQRFPFDSFLSYAVIE